jgi:hypothetical protein
MTVDSGEVRRLRAVCGTEVEGYITPIRGSVYLYIDIHGFGYGLGWALQV